MAAFIRKRVKAARRRGAAWVQLLDVTRLIRTAEGRARLWTRLAYRSEIHQTTPYTAENRYPELFDFVARLAPDTRRILSFGCSTGEELVALRRRFPQAEIVGTEINPRSRRIAARRLSADANVVVVPPGEITGKFDAIFALAVFQLEPHTVEEVGTEDLSGLYPFQRFDDAVTGLVERIEPGGLLCVINSHYRVEDSSVAAALQPVKESPLAPGPYFGADGRRIGKVTSRTVFRKRARAARPGGGR